MAVEDDDNHEKEEPMEDEVNKAKYEQFEAEPGARKPRPRPRSRSSQPETKPDEEVVEKHEVKEETKNPSSVIKPMETEFEHYESELGAKRPRCKATVDTLKADEKKPVPRPRSVDRLRPKTEMEPVSAPAPTQAPVMMETNLDDILAGEQSVPVMTESKSGPTETNLGQVIETDLDQPMETSFDQYEEEPGRRKPRLKPVTEKLFPGGATKPVMASVPGQAHSQLPVQKETSFDQYEEEPGARQHGGRPRGPKSDQPQQSMTESAPDQQTPQQTPQQTEQPQPKKERMKGRRQIGGPKQGQREHLAPSQSQLQTLAPLSGRPHNTSFGPEDEEVASINAQAKARKEAIKAKKLKEHEWAMKQKQAHEESQHDVASEWEQALMAAQAQHGKIPAHLKTTRQGQSKGQQQDKEDHGQGKSRIITPIPGVEITITGDVGEVSGPEQNSGQVMPDRLMDKSFDSDKGGKKGFLKFPSKKKKKDKDKDKVKASAEELTSDGEGKKGLFGRSKKKQKVLLNTSITSSADEEGMYESLTNVDQAGVTPVKSAESLEATSPQSPEGYGIEQTVMGAKVERDDTVIERPQVIKKGGFFNMPSKRKKKESDEDFGAVPYNEAPDIEPKQSGSSQDEILARVMQQNSGQPNRQTGRQAARQAAMDDNLATQGSSQQQYVAHPGPPLPPPNHQRPTIPQTQGPRAPPKETGIDDDLELAPVEESQKSVMAIQPAGQLKNEPMETNIDDDLPLLLPPTAEVQNLQSHGHSSHSNYPSDAQVVAGMWQQQYTPHQQPEAPQQQQPWQHHPPPLDPHHQQTGGPTTSQCQETNLDDLPPDQPPQTFSRNQVGRVSKGRRKGRRGPPSGGSASEEPKDELPTATSSVVFNDNSDIFMRGSQGSQGVNGYHPEPHQLQPVDDTALVSQLWKSKKDQEEDMMRVLASTQPGAAIEDNLYEQPVCHQGHEAHPSPNVEKRHGRKVRPQPIDGSTDRQLKDVAMETLLQQQQQLGRGQRSQGKPPLPAHKPPVPSQPRSFQHEPVNQAPALPHRRAARTDDATAAAQMWSQQHEKAAVVEMQPPGANPRNQPPGSDPWNQGSTAPSQNAPGRRPWGGGRRGPPSTSSLPGAMSDSEAMRNDQHSRGRRGRSKRPKQRRGISFEADHHSEAEMHEYEAPMPPKDPGKSLQEAALETITAGLKNQPKITPYRAIVPESERQINYTRGVYRPKPMNWRGSSRSSTGSGGRYDDSSLVSSLWSQQHPAHTADSEGEADTEGDPSYYEDSPERHSNSGSLGRQSGGFHDNSMERQSWSGPTSGPPPPGHQGPHPGHHPGQPYYPGHPPPSPKRSGAEASPVRRRPKKKKKQWVTEPGPVDFSQYGPTAKIWMEQVDEKTVQKSQTMFLSVMPKDHKLHPDIENSMPPDTRTSTISMGDDDVFLPPQWVIARGRNMRRKKRQLDRQRAASGASSGGSDLENERPMSPGRQMLLFFRVGSNWHDLAWILFDEIQNDPETIRTIKDIELKCPNHLTSQVHDLMHRWWKRKGNDATIEELRRALDLVHIPYIMEECFDQRSSVTAYSGSEDNLDISQISDQDPNVSRLMQEYEIRSLNASFNVEGALSDSGIERKQSYNLSEDSLMRRLNEKGVTINRSKLGSGSSSLGRNSSRGHHSMDESVDYYSDGESRRSFIIVQPQLKAGDYRHETNL